MVPGSEETDMIVTIDNMAHRYSLLPSEVLGRGTTFDLYVLGIATKWDNYRHEQANKKAGMGSNSHQSAAQPSTEKMLDMLKYARTVKNDSNKNKV